MAIVIFGGDRLGNIPDLLKDQGFNLVQHITGRKQKDLKIDIPREAEGVLVFVDFLSHNVALEVKAAVKRKGIRAIFVKRSWTQIRQALDKLRLEGECV